MKEPEKTYVSQYCLDIVSLPNFIKSLPKSIDIAQLTWRAVYRKGRQKLAIPEAIKKTGIKSATWEAAPLNVRGTYPMVSAETVLRNTGTIARHFSIPEDRFFVQHITLMDKEHTSSVSFKRMYKQIRLPNDKRRKKLVLGLVKSDGANHVKIMAKLSAKKITCTLMKTEKTIVMCSEEVVVK